MRRGLRVVHCAIALSAFAGLADAADEGLRVFVAESVTPEGIVHLAVDSAALGELAGFEQVRLEDVPVAEGLALDLSLSRVNVYGDQAQIVVATGDAERQLPVSPSLLFTGTVAGDADSLAALSVSAAGIQGFVELDGETFIVSSGPATGDGALVSFGMQRIPADLIDWAEFHCHADDIAQIPALLRKADGLGGAGPRADAPCRVVPLAIESDREFLLDLFGDDTAAATAYVELLIGATNEVYKRDFNAVYELVYLRLWETDDPWNQGNTVDQLYQFQAHWEGNMNHVSRALAHFLSGRGLGGGVAWLGVICWDGYNYALSANLAGYFPYPLQDNHSQNWDFMVFAHEGGHNFGAPHTHDVAPPIDGCAYGDCSVGPNGTIMSYCHLCDGGMSNIVLNFHDRIINEEVLPWLQWSMPCDLTVGPPDITGQPVGGSVCVGDEFVLSVAAGGDELTYQWRLEGSDIGGATSDSYTITDATLADAGTYDVLVSNNCESVFSDPADVSVYSLAADLNGDGVVGQEDLGLLLAAYGQNDGGDVDGDGDTDQADLGLLLAQYGESCV